MRFWLSSPQMIKISFIITFLNGANIACFFKNMSTTNFFCLVNYMLQIFPKVEKFHQSPDHIKTIFPLKKYACQMTSPSSLILVHVKEKGRFCLKILMHTCRLHPHEFFSRKIVVPICNHFVEFDCFYRVEIYGQPCIVLNCKKGLDSDTKDELK